MSDTPREDPRPAARPVRPAPPSSDYARNGREKTESNVSGEVPAEPTKSAKPKKWRPSNLSIALANVALWFALITLIVIVYPGDSNYMKLETTCQTVVKNNLKSPSSAKFIGVPQSDGTYIRGEVDAQNSFGLVIRNSFRCTIINSDTVRLDYIR